MTAALATETSCVEEPSPSSPPLEQQHDNEDSTVQVAVRVRPLLASEQGSDFCMQILHDNCLRIGGSKGPRFTFDTVFESQSNQATIYQISVAPLVQKCLEGYNATILAYGQTGSGKTHTIMGPPNHRTTTSLYKEDAGVIPRAVQSLFSDLIAFQQDKKVLEFTVKVQFLELYGEAIRDLLTSHPEPLSIRDTGRDEPEVVGATQQTVHTPEEALLCLNHGMLRRVTGATAMNESSSRSHAILSVLVEQSILLDAQEQHVQVKRSKFNFVDLAGSERQKRTQAQGQRLKEGIDINKGLLVLGNVISALGDPKKRGKTFVPYRDSKLTRLLKGSLGGNHKTLMMACVSPSSHNMEESLNCLRYANRAKNIQNNAIVNLDASSKLVAELQERVKVLACDLLKVWDGDTTNVSFTREAVQSLVAGSGGGGGSVPVRSQAPTEVTPEAANKQEDDERVQELEIELSRTRDLLRESQKNHDLAEEQLHVVKAEKELLQLQLAVSRDDSSQHSGSALEDEKDRAFMEKASEYEKEIQSLRQALQSAESKMERMKLVQDELLADGGGDDWRTSIDEARKVLGEDREKLEALKCNLSSSDEDSQASLSSDDGAGTSEQLDAEEKAEQAHLDKLTEKYLAKSGHVEDDDGEVVATEPAGEDKDGDVIEDTYQRHQHIKASLEDISRNIAAKEDLINQLKLSQEKYASMREFYEGKLEQMEEALNEKESEREELVRELVRTKQADQSTKELEDRLLDKERHIVNLKKKQIELRRLTAVSSRNDAEISRLQNDIVMMKRKKVDLQKQLNQERKHHAKEMKKLATESLQKDRELNKYKRISTQREAEAHKAAQVSKARLEELGKLRTKYKDAEKKLRMLSVKRGVMAKAGLDSVLIGRRDSKREGPTETQQAQDEKTSGNIDANAMRDYFDHRVAEVVRKEALVNKLAEEWEEHFELSKRKEELLLDKSEDSEDAAQSLTVQIQYKEDRIRQLARRIGKEKESRNTNDDSGLTESKCFVFDEEFAKSTEGASIESSKSAAARTLFGMVVRERRRVAALARTASSLDERVQAAEQAAESSEAALRSYIDEQRHELAALNQNQQEQILSLMDMVKDSDTSTAAGIATYEGHGSAAKSVTDPQLVLANERIHVLERQIQGLQSQAGAAESYRESTAELSSSLATVTRENEDLQADLSHLRAAMRQVREMASKRGTARGSEENNDSMKEILEIVKLSLHPSHAPAAADKKRPSKSPRSRSSDRLFLSPRLKKHVELMHTSDSSDDVDNPDWANEIMADLALIAEGKVPPSMENSPAVIEAKLQIEETVFDRLNNPESFTGTQKVARDLKKKHDKRKAGKSPTMNGQEERRVMSQEIADQLDRIVLPDAVVPGPKSIETPSNVEVMCTPSGGAEVTPSSDRNEYKSVFERLVSPSQYTGTQKEKFQQNQQKISRDTEDGDDKLLDDLLRSEDSHEHGENKGASRSSTTNYTEQDVFERLQKTTTQSYAVKHNGTMFPDHSGFSVRTSSLPVLGSTNTHGPSQEGRSPPSSNDAQGQDFSSHSDYTNQNVFERLQKTTTEAYAKKTNKGKRGG